MKNIKFFYAILSVTLLLGSFSCSNKKVISEYSKQLEVNFPENMSLVHYDVQSDFQDYSIQSIYKLSFNQKNALLEEIYLRTCDSSNDVEKLYSCWQKCDDFYSFEYQNKDAELEIKIVFVAKNDIRTLSVYEYKL